jgi:hypothetical protein
MFKSAVSQSTTRGTKQKQRAQNDKEDNEEGNAMVEFMFLCHVPLCPLTQMPFTGTRHIGE